MMDPKSKIEMKYITPKKCTGSIMVQPPKEVAQEECSKWEASMVRYFISKKLPFQLVKASAMCMWNPKGLFEVSANEKGFYFFRFSSVTNRNEVLEAGLWHIGGQPIILRKWKPLMKLSKETLDKIPVWVEFFNIPNEY